MNTSADRFCTRCGAEQFRATRFCGSCGAPRSAVDATYVQSPPPPPPMSGGVHTPTVRSKAWFVFLVVGLAQIAAMFVQLDNSGIFSIFSGIPSLIVQNLVLAAPIIELGFLGVRKQAVDPQYVAAGVASSLVVAVRGIVMLIDSLQYTESGWSVGATVGLLQFLSLFVIVFGLLELVKRGTVSVEAMRQPTMDQWRVLIGVGAMVVLIVESPGYVLPDRFPVLSLISVVGIAVLGFGDKQVRRGAYAGLALTIAAASGLVSRLFGDGSIQISTACIVALVLCAVGIIEALDRQPGGLLKN